jgi:hypothetical protein
LNSALCCFLFTPTFHAPFWTGQPLAYPAVQKSGAAAVGRANILEISIGVACRGCG